MRRRLFQTLFAAVGVTAVLLGTQTAAHAETHGGTDTWQVVQQNTDDGYCRAEVGQYGTTAYARALFYNDHAGWDCTMWLERSTDYGKTWFLISDRHTLRDLSTADLDSTYPYWDGSGYRARACFHLNFAGAAKHCTYAIGGFID
jgi:hypothetical protein